MITLSKFILSISLLLSVMARTTLAMPFPWESIEPGLPGTIADLVIDPDQNAVFLVLLDNGSVFKSEDWGRTLRNVTPAGVEFTALCPDSFYDSTWYAVSGDSLTWISRSNGEDWASLGGMPGTAIQITSSHHYPGQLLGRSSTFPDNHQEIFRSTDEGHTWQTVLSAPGNEFPVFWHPTDPNIAIWGSLFSDDAGLTWSNRLHKHVHDVDRAIPPGFFSAETDGLFRTRDDLTNWWPVYTSPVDFVTVSRRTPDVILTGQSQSDEYTLLLSRDGGDHFSAWTNGIPGRFDRIFMIADWLFWGIKDGRIYQYDERRADIDGSGRIDGGDLVILSLAFGSLAGDPRYIPEADLNEDGGIDGNDLVIISTVWGLRFDYDDSIPPGDFPGDGEDE